MTCRGRRRRNLESPSPRRATAPGDRAPSGDEALRGTLDDSRSGARPRDGENPSCRHREPRRAEPAAQHGHRLSADESAPSGMAVAPAMTRSNAIRALRLRRRTRPAGSGGAARRCRSRRRPGSGSSRPCRSPRPDRRRDLDALLVQVGDGLIDVVADQEERMVAGPRPQPEPGWTATSLGGSAKINQPSPASTDSSSSTSRRNARAPSASSA